MHLSLHAIGDSFFRHKFDINVFVLVTGVVTYGTGRGWFVLHLRHWGLWYFSRGRGGNGYSIINTIIIFIFIHANHFL